MELNAGPCQTLVSHEGANSRAVLCLFERIVGLIFYKTLRGPFFTGSSCIGNFVLDKDKRVLILKGFGSLLCKGKRTQLACCFKCAGYAPY